jgi:oligoribonuclease (3'-5' exoribonuclease)
MSEENNKLKYVSIDIETTGADRNNDDIVEITAKIDDLSNIKPTNELPRFHCYVVKERYSGCSWAFSRHAEIFKEIERGGAECIHEGNVAQALFNFIDENFGYIGIVEKDLYNNTCSRIILPAGKNFASFDLHFLYRLPNFKGLLGFPTRSIDVGNMYLLPSDVKPPSLTECAKRAGLNMEVNHRSDNEVDMVIGCVRHFLMGKEIQQPF